LNGKSATPIPGAIEQLQRQLDEFRSTRPHRTKLPETLWQAAVELARQHGVYSVAHPLRLDYTGLKKRLDGVPDHKKKTAKPAFVELITKHSATMVRFRRGCEACLCESGPTAHGPSALEVIGKQGVHVIADAIAQIVADSAHTV